MVSGERVDQSPAPQPSVLELCMMQQSNHQSGIRLSFNSEMTEPITLEKLPFHFCAVTGNVNLAAFLYLRQVPFSRNITIANFAADGKEGSTPWKKPITLSPVDIANMAGHKPAALVLSLIGARVPLQWSRQAHSLYPKFFKQQAKALMETLLTLPFFTGLPGSARVQLVDTLMTTLAHECVWAPLAPAVWQGRWSECLDDNLEAAEQLSEPQNSSMQLPANPPAMASYQFQIRARHPSRPRLSKAMMTCLVAGLVLTDVLPGSYVRDVLLLTAGLTEPVGTAIGLGVRALLGRLHRRS